MFGAKPYSTIEIHAHAGVGISQTGDDHRRDAGRRALFAGNDGASQFARLGNNVCKSHVTSRTFSPRWRRLEFRPGDDKQDNTASQPLRPATGREAYSQYSAMSPRPT